MTSRSPSKSPSYLWLAQRERQHGRKDSAVAFPPPCVEREQHLLPPLSSISQVVHEECRHLRPLWEVQELREKGKNRLRSP